jgi:hypothetical protein
MAHSTEQLRDKIKAMVYLIDQVVLMEETEYNEELHQHMVDSIKALAGDVYNENSNTE